MFLDALKPCLRQFLIVNQPDCETLLNYPPNIFVSLQLICKTSAQIPVFYSTSPVHAAVGAVHIPLRSGLLVARELCSKYTKYRYNRNRNKRNIANTPIICNSNINIYLPLHRLHHTYVKVVSQ